MCAASDRPIYSACVILTRAMVGVAIPGFVGRANAIGSFVEGTGAVPVAGVDAAATGDGALVPDAPVVPDTVH